MLSLSSVLTVGPECSSCPPPGTQVMGAVPSPGLQVLISSSHLLSSYRLTHYEALSLHPLGNGGNCYPGTANQEADARETVTLESSLSHAERARIQALLSPVPSWLQDQTSELRWDQHLLVHRRINSPPLSVVFESRFFRLGI